MNRRLNTYFYEFRDWKRTDFSYPEIYSRYKYSTEVSNFFEIFINWKYFEKSGRIK